MIDETELQAIEARCNDPQALSSWNKAMVHREDSMRLLAALREARAEVDGLRTSANWAQAMEERIALRAEVDTLRRQVVEAWAIAGAADKQQQYVGKLLAEAMALLREYEAEKDIAAWLEKNNV